MRKLENAEFDKTPGAQIHRLTKPGSRYLNLNPYEVLQVSTDATMDIIKAHYRQVRMLTKALKTRPSR